MHLYTSVLYFPHKLLTDFKDLTSIYTFDPLINIKGKKKCDQGYSQINGKARIVQSPIFTRMKLLMNYSYNRKIIILYVFAVQFLYFQYFNPLWLSFVLISVSLNDAYVLKSVNLSSINCSLLDLIFVVYLNNIANDKILQFKITSIARFS